MSVEEIIEVELEIGLQHKGFKKHCNKGLRGCFLALMINDGLS